MSAAHALRGRRGISAVWICIAAAYTWVAVSANDLARWVVAVLMALASCALAHVVYRDGLEGQGAFFGILLSAVSSLRLSLCETAVMSEMATHVVTVATGCVFAGIYAAVWCVAPH